MKKIVLLAFLMLLLTCLTWAKPITIDQARQVATNIIVERSSLTTSEIVETNVDRDDSGQPLFYIFNFRPKAFVMVAAEDNVLPVLGYCLDQTYSNSNHPIQFDDLLWSYRGQIQYARTHNLADTPVIRNNWQRLSVASNQFVPLDEPNRNVAPIIQTNWGQGTYYNYYCPSGTPVGCVAVAMGQIMKHWSFPAMGTGSHSYSCPPYGTQTANFGTTSYSWSLMPSSLTTNNTYLATLLYHLGVSVNMQYAPGGSGAYDNDAKSALTTYFGYKSTSSLIQKSGYTGGDTAWDLKMKSEIDAGRPVYYSGSGPAGGHAFDLDGYQGTAYPYQFHFNWGWDSYYNGYYVLSSLNPGGDTFNSGCEAIVGIEPGSPTSTTLTEGFDTATTIPSTWVVTPSSTWAVESSYYNSSPYAVYYQASGTVNSKRLVTPKLTVSAGNTISFYARNNATARAEQIKVKWTTDMLTFNDFSTAQTTTVLTSTFTQYTFNIGNLKTGDYYVAFETYSTNTNSSQAKLFILDTVVGPPLWINPSPVVSLNTSSWAAGNVDPGAAGSSGDNFAITNTGGGTLTITSATMSGTGASKFSTNFSTGTVLQHSGVYPFGFTYEPTAYASDTATYTIVTNGGTVVVNLTGSCAYNVFQDGFESYTNFAISFAPWTCTDVDGGQTWGVSGYSWTNVNVPQSFIIFNPSMTSPAMTTTAGSTHSGSKMAVAWDTVTASAPNNDWLITPLLSLSGAGTATVNFWAKAFSSGFPAEKFSVMYSTTTNAVASFTNTIQATVTMTSTQNDWTFYTWTLTAAQAAVCKYIGIHVTSNDQFAFMLDDFYIHDASTAPAFPNLGNVEGHVYAYGTMSPLANALVTIGLKSATTNEFGYYKINSLVVGTYSMTCSAPGTSYFTSNAASVAITSGATTTQDFGLKWSSIAVTPTTISQTLNPFATMDRTLTVSNPTGTADLNYGVYMQSMTRNNEKPQFTPKGDKLQAVPVKPSRVILNKVQNDRSSSGWMSYSDGYTAGSYVGGSNVATYLERGVYYSLDSFGLFSNPVTVTQLRHTFYQDPDNVWGTSNTFKFRIYAADMTTVLFTSPTITAVSSWTTGSTNGYADVTTYTLPTPMTFSTDFIVSVIPTNTTTGYPASEVTAETWGWSILSTASPATAWSGPYDFEFCQGVYLSNYDVWAGFSSYSGVIAPGSSQDITVHFDAANLNGSSKSAYAYFVNDAIYHTPTRGDNLPVSLNLTVNSITTPIPVLNTSNWTSITASNTSASSGSVFTLTNMGIGTLTVSSITNLSATDFSTTFVPTGIALTNGQSYSFGFSYHPTSAGVDNITFDIVTSNGTVTVTLNGYGDYTLEGFEGTNFPPDGWANIDQDADTYKWYSLTTTGYPYEGAKCAASASWMADAKSATTSHESSRLVLTPDNYLITPKLSISTGDVLKYWISALDADFPAEHYSVKVSTTNASVSSFTTELFAETMTDGVWHERSIDLSAYAHQSIYLAFEHHACTDQNELMLDNVLYPVLAAPLQYGSLKGNVFKYGTTTPIENATVTINGLSAVSDADGYYEIADILVGTYDATCTKPTGSYYFDQTLTGVVINADEPTSQDFELTWAELSVSPTSFDVTLPGGQTTDRQLAIGNPAGTTDLQYYVSLWDTSTRNITPLLTAAKRPVLDRNLANALPTDVKITNHHGRTYGWYGYASTDDADIYTWAGTERATKYVLQDLGLLKPVTISQISSFFYNPSGTPWADATFHFVIYAADGTTVLYTSPDIEAVSLTEATHTLTTPIVVNDDFYVSVVPTDVSGSPFTLGTDLYSGNSYYKSSGVWTLATSEYLNYVYAEGAGWLTVSNGSGTVTPGTTANVGLHFDATGLSNTSRTCTIAVYNNSNNTSARGVTRQIPVVFTITAGGIAAPTGIVAALDGGNIVLTWDAVSGASSYTVYGTNDPYSGTWVAAQTGISTTTYTTSTDQAYRFYRVTAVSGTKHLTETPVGKPISAKK